MGDEPRDVVLRLHRDRRYKTVNCHAAEADPSISWKAAGIHWYLITRPNRWKFRVADVVNRHTDGRIAVQAGLKELEEAGYLRRVKSRNSGQFSGWEWHVSEVPLGPQEWLSALATDEQETCLSADEQETCASTDEQVSRPSGNPSVRKPAHVVEVLTTGNSKQTTGVKNTIRGAAARPDLVLIPGDPDATEPDPAEWMHDAWHHALGASGGQRLPLTAGRRKKYRAMFDEQLSGSTNPQLGWRAVLEAVKRSDFHMKTRGYQMPESLLLNPERRSRWVEVAVDMIGKAAKKSADADTFAAEYNRRRAAGRAGVGS